MRCLVERHMAECPYHKGTYFLYRQPCCLVCEHEIRERMIADKKEKEMKEKK
jgi:hypothetical protein